jgi:hypothetical protein
MFIKNRIFRDGDTLLETLFDFDLGNPGTIILEKRQQIEDDLKDNQALKDYIDALTDEEEKLEVATEERYIRLAESLMDDFKQFQVEDRKLYGINEGQRTLLFEIDL